MRQKEAYKLLVGGVVIGALLACLALAGYWWLARVDTQGSEVDRIRRSVGALMELPEDEVPTLATIADDTKITNDFLKAGKTGDRVLIYAKHRQAIIYREATNRIIAVGPVYIAPLSKEAQEALRE